MTDAFTKYAEIVAIPNKEVITVVDAVFTKWMCRYSYSAIIHTDMGKEFINKISTELFANTFYCLNQCDTSHFRDRTQKGN